MDVQIIKEEKKPLMNRKDVTARVSFESSTPSRNDIRKEIGAKLEAKEELVIVTKILPENGKTVAVVEAKVYTDEKSLKDIEHRFTLKRHGFAIEEKKVAAAPAAAPKKKIK